MNTYPIVLVLHILSATVLVGGSAVAAPLVRVGARRARTYEALRTVLALGAPLRVINPAAALGLLATGTYLATLLHFWQLGWVQVGVAIWVTSVLVAARVVGPHMGRLGAATAGREGAVGEVADELRWSARWTVASGVLFANDVAVILVMVLKPTVGTSLLLAVTANLFVQAGLWLASARRNRAHRRTLALQP